MSISNQLKKFARIRSINSPLCTPPSSKVKITSVDFKPKYAFATMTPLGSDGSDFAESYHVSPISSVSTYVYNRFETQTSTYTLQLICEDNDVYLNCTNANYIGNGRIFKLTDLIILE